MPSKAPTLAKLTRPKLFDALPRTRLFERLDECRQHPIVWIAAPPGAGKTTLVATYLDARKLAGIWFHVDASDANPATFFHYLGIAAPRATVRRKGLLPVIGPEYANDLPGFSRYFFRQLFNRLSIPATLVFDNYHEVDADATFHRLFADGLFETPEGINIFVISRSEPPAALSRLIAAEQLRVLNWQDLRLSLDETTAIARCKVNIDNAEINKLHQQVQGWAAGVTLMLERFGCEVSARRNWQSGGTEHVFNYFAGEIFDRLAADVRELLLRSALFPQFSVKMAEEISGNPGARPLLEQLYRKHLFIHRRGGADGMYQYHDLFRAFLNERATSVFTADERARLTLSAAVLLDGGGLADDAFDLYIAASAFQEAARLAVAQAVTLVGQGRHQTVVDWTDRISRQSSIQPPWLAYWRGVALVPLDPAKARESLERAYDTFVVECDPVGEIMAAAGIIDSYYFENRRFEDMDRWLAVLERQLSRRLTFPGRLAELRVYSAAVFASLYRRPSNPLLPGFVGRVTELIEQPLDVNGKVTAALVLMSFATFSGHFTIAERLVPLISPLVRDDKVSPLNRYYWSEWLGYFLILNGKYAEGRAALDETDSLAERHHLHYLAANALLMRTIAAVAEGDTASAQEILAKLDARTNRVRSQDVGMENESRAWAALLLGDPQSAIAYAERALADAEDFGNEMLKTFWRIPLAFAFIESGRCEAALEICAQLRVRAEGACMKRPLFFSLALGAAALFELGRRQEATEALRQMLATAKSFNLGSDFGRLRRLMPKLCAEALGLGIEGAYVRELIRKFSWSPPSADIESWPWPVKVFTFEHLSVFKDGEPLTFGRKAQKKPLDLLKCLIASGGRNVNISSIGDLLWPDAEADAAERTLETTLLRLRRLLGREDAIVRRDGKLSLNPGVCWVDAWAFEQHADNLDGLPRDQSAQKDWQENLTALLRLYPDHFLAREAKEPWMLSMANRLHTKFKRVILSAGQFYEGMQHWERAVAVYDRGLELDELAEEFSRRLIFCYQHLGRHDDAQALLSHRERIRSSDRSGAIFSAVGSARPRAVGSRE